MTYDPEIEKLLPWYAKGLLEPDETAKVDIYLAAHPEMRMQLDLIEEEITAIDQQHAALGAPSPDGLQRLLGDIDALEAKEAPITQAASNAATGLMDKVKSFFAGFSSPGMQFAGMAAAFVVVAQGVIIGGLLSSDPTPQTTQPSYTTASGQQQKAEAEGSVFLVAFKKDARMSDVAALLKDLSAKIVTGPKGGGFFEIMVPTAKLPEGGADAVLDALKARADLIQFASAVK